MTIEKYNNHCCGCGVCAVACPAKAITMRENNQGFFYPSIDKKKCIQCGRCNDSCAFNQANLDETEKQLKETYAVKHTDENIRAASRSGGVFTAISDMILERGGVVYGCALEDNRKAVHRRATTKGERDLFRGSKYIQSRTEDIFAQVKSDLIKGNTVLFSGTACQVAAVKSFCKGVNCDKLLLVDIVCHGTPSPKVWSDYMMFIEKQNNQSIATVDFRDKERFGWTAHKETFVFKDNSVYSSDIFKTLFYDHYILRRDCFECPYKHLERTGDISIADCWGIREQYPDFGDDKGVSLVLVNTKKGRFAYESLSTIESISVDVEKLMQPPLRENWPIPADYDTFWRKYQRQSFEKIIDQYVLKKKSFLRRGLQRLRRLCGRIYHKAAK